MAIKTVLSILSVDNYDEDLKSAVEFCSMHSAHLSALVLSLGTGPVYGEFNAFSIAWLDERQREMEELAEKTAGIKELLKASDISWDVQDVYTEFAFAEEDIAERALYADLVLIGRQAAADEDLRKRVIEGALFQTATPILINRGRHPVDAALKSVLVAWDSSNEASRAARQSLDLLKMAETVYVTMVDPVARPGANGEEPGADIATTLARHGVNVQVDRIASGGRRADEVLRQHALDVSADLIVMGAYNHPRWQQTLFGGVTRSMIEDSKLPIFMAH